MSLFHLDWFVCQDGYRLEERPAPRRARLITQGKGAGLVIAPNSDAWFPSKPLDIPGLYREFCDCDLRGPEGLLRFIEYNGLLFRAKASKEALADVIEHVLGMRRLLAAIDRRDWRSIADALTRANQEKLFPSGGIGRLGILFDLPKKDGAPPSVKLQPASLADALQVQALADASLGVLHKKCKNPECDHYFPLSGPNALRRGAEYHSTECRLRHRYVDSKQRRSKK